MFHARFCKQAPLPDGPDRDELVGVRLTPDFFEAANAAMTDVRIADSRLESVPFLITRRTVLTNDTERETVHMTRIGFEDRPDRNEIILLFERHPQTPPPDRLRLDTPLRDFEKAVTVQGSDDRQAWRPLTESAVIFDASRFLDAARLEVPFTSALCRYYQVTIHDVTDVTISPTAELRRFRGNSETGQVEETERSAALQNRNFQIRKVVFSRDRTRSSITKTRLMPVPLGSCSVHEDSAKRQTLIRFDTRRTPVTEIRLHTTSRNFSRRYTLTAQPLESPPSVRRTLARGSLTRFAFRTLNQESTTIAFPENRSERYELVIENGDNPTLDRVDIDAQGPEYQMLYLSGSNQTGRLYLGAPSMRPPAFDLSLIQSALDQGLPPLLIGDLAAVVDNPEYAARAGWRLNSPAALRGALLLMALALGAALLKAFRQSSGSDEAPPTE